MRGAGHVVRAEELKNAYRYLVGKPERKREFLIPRRRREDNIKVG
jgi:hypothetical protein